MIVMNNNINNDIIILTEKLSIFILERINLAIEYNETKVFAILRNPLKIYNSCLVLPTLLYISVNKRHKPKYSSTLPLPSLYLSST